LTLLALAVLVLLPALAWLQYSWLDQIADADRDRRTRTLQTAASQLAQDFDGEVGKAILGLQLEPAIVEDRAWSRYAERYQLWADSAIAPEIVKAVYFVDAPSDQPPPPDAPRLRVWQPSTHTFDETAWPAELDTIKTRFAHDGRAVLQLQVAGTERPGPRERGGAGDRDRLFQRLMMPPTPIGDEQTVVVPIMRVTMSESAGAAPTGPPDVKLLGFTIIRLDAVALASDVLPALVRRHLYDERGRSEFHIAVVARDDPSRVLFESDPGAAKTASASPDTAVPLLGSRVGPFLFMSREGRRGGARLEVTRERRPPPPPAPPGSPADNVVVNVFEAHKTEGGVTLPGRGVAAGDGHWRLVAKHRAGSLEAAVAAARTRNFGLSSGILALLAAAIALIVVSARRADRLARQQLEFVAAVSHELRTPVAVIGTAAGNLADGLVDEPGRVKKYGATIQAEARRLAETVERVLQLAGLAAGRSSSLALVPGHQLIGDAVAAVTGAASAAGVTVERRLPDVLPSVRGDAGALGSALQNLIGNAVKYSGEARWVGVSAHAAGSVLRIAVSDRGLGISAEDRKHIFEPFYRGREAVSRQIQGSGLGLHLVQRIVEAHGGTITVQSEPGRGSTFTIELPTAADPQAAERLPLAMPESAPRGRA
jgi:signal transduction histidine kinase